MVIYKVCKHLRCVETSNKDEAIKTLFSDVSSTTDERYFAAFETAKAYYDTLSVEIAEAYFDDCIYVEGKQLVAAFDCPKAMSDDAFCDLFTAATIYNTVLCEIGSESSDC